MAFSKGYRNTLCSRKQQHVCFCLAHLLLTVCVHLGRQGEFKCKAAEQSTERKMKESEAITDNGIIDGRNLKRKCIWYLMTSYFWDSHFQFPALEYSWARVQACSLCLSGEKARRGSARRAQSSPSSPSACCSASDLRDLLCAKPWLFNSGVCSLNFFHVLENKGNGSWQGDEKSQMVLSVSDLEPYASPKCPVHSLSSQYPAVLAHCSAAIPAAWLWEQNKALGLLEWLQLLCFTRADDLVLWPELFRYFKVNTTDFTVVEKCNSNSIRTIPSDKELLFIAKRSAAGHKAQEEKCFLRWSFTFCC